MTSLPPSEAAQTAARRYEKIRLQFFLLETVLSLGVTGVFALAGPAQWLARAVEPLCGSGVWAVLVFTSFCLAGVTLLFLPLDYAGGFCLEHRFQLSNQHWTGWLADQAKALGVKLVILNMCALAIWWLLRTTGAHWWIWAGGFWLVCDMVLNHLFPILVLPLFFKIEPLSDAHLKNRLLLLAERTGARVVDVYRFDMSRKTKKANALFAGLGRTKRIILGDTLLDHFQPDEIEAVLAHELGHYVHRHIVWQMAGSAIAVWAGLWLVSLVLSPCGVAAGGAGTAGIAALPAIGFLLSLLALVAMPAAHAFSRYCERQADRFALETTANPDAFKRGMEKLAAQNLANPDPHPAVEFFFYSHPCISKRIRMAEEFAARGVR